MSSSENPERTIQIAEDLNFQFRMTRLQRIGKVLLCLVLLAALAGLLGGGPFSRATTRDAAGRLSIRYDRFARAMDSQTLDVELYRDRSGDTLEIWIDSQFLSGVELESVTPSPAGQSASANGIHLNIDVEPPADRPLVTIRYRPLAPGWLSGSLRADGSAASFGQLVYP